jgi:glycosyltransferase involved in cell wall biosynthesis
LLAKIEHQETKGLFTYSIVIVDNDRAQSAEPVAIRFAESSAVPTLYCVEPEQNIALARNRAIVNSSGDFVAFIDDDEFPIPQWLATLFDACQEHGVDGVLGPVNPHFSEDTPQWVMKGKFYNRPTYPTGFVIDWPKGRTGNVLLKRHIFANFTEPFRREFRAGEDQDFFRRAIESGYVFIWCDEAVAYEVVPAIRWKRTFMLRRALLRGATAQLQPSCGVFDISKSFVAVLVYVAILPFALAVGQHKFMAILVRLFDHLGKLLAVAGINAIKEPYVTE